MKCGSGPRRYNRSPARSQAVDHRWTRAPAPSRILTERLRTSDKPLLGEFEILARHLQRIAHAGCSLLYHVLSLVYADNDIAGFSHSLILRSCAAFAM
jgi:hypothetical protein